jgi:uncharacterized hydrophobic protein (TIGR00271 family)
MGIEEENNMDERVQVETQPPGLYLIHDSTLDPLALAEQIPETAFTAVPWSERDTPPAGARVLLCLGDEQIRDLAQQALQCRWEVGLLPHPEARQAMATLGVKGDFAQLIDHYLGTESIEADILTCNDEVVFSSVVIGRVLALRPYDINRPQTGWSIFTGSLKGLGKMALSPYKLTTGKDREIQLAALGLVALSHTQSSLVGRSFAENLSITDGRLSLLAFAPRSVISYLLFMLRLLWPKKLSLSQLPNSLALIQSDRLHLQAPRGTEYLLDGKPVHASEIELRVLDDKLRLLPGPDLVPRRDEAISRGKDTVRLNHIPADEAARPLADTPLPLFSHASEEEYRELFVSLRDSATASSSFQVLTVLSVMLALTGLYANSAPVIIGAMILAPLMSPIVSLAMGLARTDLVLIRNSLRTLLIGVAWGLACAILLAWAMPLDIPTAEMKARMSPTLLDLLVAVISGVAGAYAYAKEEIAKSLAGVAIAVALVPPLSVAGIGVGWADWDMARGAFLLLTTNLVGIALAASATFLVLGYAPFKRARKGLGITGLIMLVISAPLYVAFTHLVEKGRIMEQVPVGELELVGLPVSVGSIQVTVGDPHLVKVVLSSPQRLDNTHVDELKKIISDRVGQPVQLEAQLNIRR